jgi:predicted MFS family arabinose efflux permease
MKTLNPNLRSHQKWIVLFIFSYAAAMSQALWLNYAPLLEFVEKLYHVTEDQAGLLLMVFPLVYVLISIPAGKLIDRKGYRYSMCLGTLIMAIGSVIRISDKNFYVLLFAQTLISVAQPFIVNSISKLVLEWFDKSSEAIATGLGTMGMFIGMAFGMMTTAYLVDKISYQTTMVFFAGLTLGSFLLTVFLLKEVKILAQTKLSEDVPPSLMSFFDNKNLIYIFLLSFLGLGFFNGLTTWLEPILAPLKINSIQAGMVGGALILGGIAGAGLVPALSDYFKKRKPFLIISIFIAALTIVPLCKTPNYSLLLFLATVQGFFFLPAFSLLLQMAAEEVGEKLAGTVTGILMLLGNAGGVVVILTMEGLKSETSGFTPAVYFLFVILIFSCVLSIFLRETYRAA